MRLWIAIPILLLVACSKKESQTKLDEKVPSFSKTYSEVQDSPDIQFSETVTNPLPPSGGCFESDCVDGKAELVFSEPDKYELKVDGRIVSILKLTSENFPEVESVHLHVASNVYLITHTVFKEDTSLSQVLFIDKKSLKTKGSIKLGAENLARPRLHGDDFFVSTSGMVGKIDVTSGKFVWKHEGLLKTRKFYGADSISIVGDRVEFQGQSVNVNVDRKTGRLL